MITAVNNISFKNNYSQVNFEGRKDKEHRGHRGITNTIKAIPLATLIALSPLNTVEVNAQSRTQKPVQTEKLVGYGDYEGNPIGVEYYNQDDPKAKDYDKAYMENTNASIFLYSNDGDDTNAEYAQLCLVTPRQRTTVINGKKVTYRYSDQKIINIKSLGILNNQSLNMHNPYTLGEIYYVCGSGEEISTVGMSGTEVIKDPNRKSYKKIKSNMQVAVSKELFEDLKKVCGNSVKYWNEEIEGY